MSTTTTDSILQEALAAMNAKDNVNKSMFDVTIICTTDDHQATYWMDRLSTGVCQKTTTTTNSDDDASSSQYYPMVLAVSEDWNTGSGAGNGLGTLYAFEKACQLASKLTNGAVDLRLALARGDISASLYHTAGKGTRLAPMPAGENNNKPGVKLPFPLAMTTTSCCGNTTTLYQPMTVLESVVKQTGIYATSRKGRLSVWWGDQVFLPTATFSAKPTHHIDIMCTLLGDTAPTAEEWKAQGLDKYGVIACMETKEGKMEAAQLEKVSHETATNMLSSLGGSIRQVGPSLGSFSVSAQMLECLSHEFAAELTAKTAKLDTDPHFWMPLTLSKQDYTHLMKQKGTDEAEAEAHHDRMTKLKSSFFEQHQQQQDSNTPPLGLFGAVDVGKNACWWDYGQLKLYSKNSLLLLQDGQSANLLRQFLGLEDGQKVLQCAFADNAVTVDDASYALDVKSNSGTIEKSLLAAVRAMEIHANGAIIVNCAAKKITAGPGSILYNVITNEEIVVEAGQVMVGVMDQDGKDFVLKSRMDIDGGDAWKKKLEMNEMSFEDVHDKNKGANIVEIQKKRAAKFQTIASSLGF